MLRHFINLRDWSKEDLLELLERAVRLKAAYKRGEIYQPLKGKTLAMIFEKASTRTRVSFEVGMYQLGGQALNINSQTSQLGRGETYADTAKVLSHYVNAIMLRTFKQSNLVEMAAAASVPVINGLSDLLHPCQVLADLLTIQEYKGNLAKLKIVWLGDSNNMSNTWLEAAMIFGFELVLAIPESFKVSADLWQRVMAGHYANITINHSAEEAVRGADVLYADTWISMGQEELEAAAKKAILRPFQINSSLLERADVKAIVLHCLPAHREEEITSVVIDGPQSRVFDQAENRLHLQKALLEKLISVN
ncbi:MAG: ornithine carbamoyltransferase [Candidatus Komeilibacteria bacterium]|nr:ornithine carbamoyltransferase [Candidatus Komeilibacteria bacterium]